MHFIFFCLPPEDVELGEPPDEAVVTVVDGPRVGSATVSIHPDDVVIEMQDYGQIELGTVEVVFETPP